MKLATPLFASTMVSAILVACGGSGGGVQDSPPVTDATLEALSGSFCDRITACYGDFFVKAFIGDKSTCSARLALELKASTRGSGAQIRDNEGVTCKSAIEAAPCNTLLDDGIALCDFRGTLADGAACAADSQCMAGACFVDEKTNCGKCGPRVAETADCTNAKCARGFTCSGQKKCVRRLPDGSACDANSVCDLGLSCINSKCSKGLAVSVACKVGKSEVPCDSFTGLYCRPPNTMAADGTCAAFTIVEPNAACGVTLTPTVDYAFCEKSQCVGATDTTKGVCQAFLADGAACDATKPPSCQFPGKCRNGKCATLDPAVCM